MDMSKYAESDYLNAEFVKASPSKLLVVINPGEIKVFEGTERVKFLVKIDGKRKYATPSRQSVKNMIDSVSKDSNDWVGQTVSLSVQMTTNNKETIVWTPQTKKPSSEALIEEVKTE